MCIKYLPVLGAEKTKLKEIFPHSPGAQDPCLSPPLEWSVNRGQNQADFGASAWESPTFLLGGEKVKSSDFSALLEYLLGSIFLPFSYLIPQEKETNHHVAFLLPSARPFQRHMLQYIHGFHRSNQAHLETQQGGQVLQHRRSFHGSIHADGWFPHQFLQWEIAIIEVALHLKQNGYGNASSVKKSFRMWRSM